VKTNKIAKTAATPTDRAEPFLDRRDAPTEESNEENEADLCDDASELDEPECEEEDDGRWDVFLFDDDSDPLPEYGDFWLPD